jgi:hypothetical protein
MKLKKIVYPSFLSHFSLSSMQEANSKTVLPNSISLLKGKIGFIALKDYDIQKIPSKVRRYIKYH